MDWNDYLAYGQFDRDLSKDEVESERIRGILRETAAREATLVERANMLLRENDSLRSEITRIKDERDGAVGWVDFFCNVRVVDKQAKEGAKKWLAEWRAANS